MHSICHLLLTIYYLSTYLTVKLSLTSSYLRFISLSTTLTVLLLLVLLLLITTSTDDNDDDDEHDHMMMLMMDDNGQDVTRSRRLIFSTLF